MGEPEEIRRIFDKLMAGARDARFAIVGVGGEVLASNLLPEELGSVVEELSSLAGELKPGEFRLRRSENGSSSLLLRADEHVLVFVKARGSTPGLMMLCARALARKAERLRAAAEVAPEAAPEAPVPGRPVYELAPEFKSVDDVLRSMPSIGVLSGSPTLMLSVLYKLEKGPVDPLTLVELVRKEGVVASERDVREMLDFLESVGVARRKTR